MNLFVIIFMILDVIVGGGSILAFALTFFGTIFYKLYRKAKYGVSLYD